MSKTTDDLMLPINKFGSVTFTHKDNAAVGVQCDRLAHDGNTLEMVSVITEPNRVKAIRAILHAKSGSPFIKTSGIITKSPSSGDLARTTPGNMTIDKEGYETFVQRMDFGMCHAVFITKNENFIRYLSPDAIWGKLNTDRYSTPLLKEWMPYVTRKLIQDKKLRECNCFRANCGILDLRDDEVLDDIVTKGIQAGAIHVP